MKEWQMVIEIENKTINTEQIVRLYTAVVINLPDGDTAEVSLKWAEMKHEEIDIKGFIIVFDLGQLNENTRNKESFFYDNWTDFEKAWYNAVDKTADSVES